MSINETKLQESLGEAVGDIGAGLSTDLLQAAQPMQQPSESRGACSIGIYTSPDGDDVDLSLPPPRLPGWSAVRNQRFTRLRRETTGRNKVPAVHAVVGGPKEIGAPACGIEVACSERPDAPG